MVDLPRIYDIQTDTWRPATQDDVDRLCRSEQMLGAAIRYLRQSSDQLNRDVAQVLVNVVQGQIDLSEASRHIFGPHLGKKSQEKGASQPLS